MMMMMIIMMIIRKENVMKYMATLQITICYANFLEKDGPITRKERKSYLSWAYRLFIIHNYGDGKDYD